MQLKVGDIVEGKVVSVKDYGAFVAVDNETSGMVHISEVANDYVNNISDFLKLGDKVKVKVLTISDEGKISFSIKKAMPKSETRENNRHKEYHPAPQKVDKSFTWSAKKQEPASFEEMMNKFKASSDEKFSDLKRKNVETRRPRRGSGH